jgi:hypothetical protein
VICAPRATGATVGQSSEATSAKSPRKPATCPPPRSPPPPPPARAVSSTCRCSPSGPPGAVSTLRVSHSKSGLHGGVVWARGALDSKKRRFLARAVDVRRTAEPRSACPPCPRARSETSGPGYRRLLSGSPIVNRWIRTPDKEPLMGRWFWGGDRGLCRACRSGVRANALLLVT